VARTASQDAYRAKAGQAFLDAKAQIRSNGQAIMTLMSRLDSLKADALAGVETGAFDQADVDEIEAEIVKLAEGKAVLQKYLAQ
jgi:hypothetical protein